MINMINFVLAPFNRQINVWEDVSTKKSEWTFDRVTDNSVIEKSEDCSPRRDMPGGIYDAGFEEIHAQ